jgi:hypothetical protein
MTHTSVKHFIEMEQPDFMGEGGGLYAEANVKIGFYLGSAVDKEKVDAAIKEAKQFIGSVEELWGKHDFNGILELYRESCCVKKHNLEQQVYGMTATEIERMERQARN